MGVWGVAIGLRKQLDKWCVFENRDTENLQDCVERLRKSESLFRDGDEQVHRYRNPDLSFDGILIRAISGHPHA